jgi:hypothetical protein
VAVSVTWSTVAPARATERRSGRTGGEIVGVLLQP